MTFRKKEKKRKEKKQSLAEAQQFKTFVAQVRKEVPQNPKLDLTSQLSHSWI